MWEVNRALPGITGSLAVRKRSPKAFARVLVKTNQDPDPDTWGERPEWNQDHKMETVTNDWS